MSSRAAREPAGGTSPSFLSGTAEGVWLAVRVQPKASRNALLGEREGRLRISVTAPPEDGKANAAVIALVAKTLGVAKRMVRLERGLQAREKTLFAEGISLAEAETRLGR